MITVRSGDVDAELVRYACQILHRPDLTLRSGRWGDWVVAQTPGQHGSRLGSWVALRSRRNQRTAS